MRAFICLVVILLLEHFKIEIPNLTGIALIFWLLVSIGQDYKEFRRK